MTNLEKSFYNGFIKAAWNIPEAPRRSIAPAPEVKEPYPGYYSTHNLPGVSTDIQKNLNDTYKATHSQGEDDSFPEGLREELERIMPTNITGIGSQKMPLPVESQNAVNDYLDARNWQGEEDSFRPGDREALFANEEPRQVPPGYSPPPLPGLSLESQRASDNYNNPRHWQGPEDSFPPGLREQLTAAPVNTVTPNIPAKSPHTPIVPNPSIPKLKPRFVSPKGF